MTWFVVLAVVAADRISKCMCRKYLEPSESIPVIKGMFHITYVQNTGAAFGMMQGRNWFFVFAIVLISSVLLYVLWKLKNANRYMSTATALVLAGAVGNLTDRIMLGYVVDFLDFRVWPVFNIADSSVVIGAVLFGYFLIVKGEGAALWTNSI